jgi:hypothetical protein
MMLTTQRPQITKRIIITRNNMINIRRRGATHRQRVYLPLTTTTITPQHSRTPR